MAKSGKKVNMALKAKIIADYRTQRFKTKTALAKFYGIDRKTLYKIIKEDEMHRIETEVKEDHLDIVDAGVQYELMKGSLRTDYEREAIERAVRKRVQMLEDDIRIMMNNRKLIQALQTKTAKKIKEDPNIGAKDINSLSNAVKNFEQVANPKELTINNTNINANKAEATNNVDNRKARIEQ